MRKPVIAGNWKMNMTCAEAIEYMRVLIPLLKDIPKKDREVVIAPPFTALYPLSELIKDTTNIFLYLVKMFTGRTVGHIQQRSPH